MTVRFCLSLCPLLRLPCLKGWEPRKRWRDIVKERGPSVRMVGGFNKIIITTPGLSEVMYRPEQKTVLQARICGGGVIIVFELSYTHPRDDSTDNRGMCLR